MTQLLIATPVDGGDTQTARVTLGYAQFVAALTHALGAETLDSTIMFCCDVVRARNRAAAYVLRELRHITHVLWLDDDTYPPDARDGVEMVRRMLALDVPLVAAPYPRKRQGGGWTHEPLPYALPDERGLVSVLAVGFGFTMTTAACLRDLSERAETYYDLPHPHRVANVFGQVLVDAGDGRRILASEDGSFCHRWRDTGGRVAMLAQSAAVVHVGAKGYTGA